MRRLLKKINLVLKLLNKHRITAIFFLIGYKPGKLHFLLQNFQLYHLLDQKVYENASLKQWQGESSFSAVAVMEQEHHVLFCPLLKLPSSNGIAPEDYFRCLFEKAPYSETENDWEKLLPWIIDFI